jgi:ATP-binding cassette subfamily C (CFTR/MRP) protein 1
MSEVTERLAFFLFVQSSARCATLLSGMYPSERSSFLSRLFFTWVTPLMRHPTTEVLNQEHLPELPRPLHVQCDIQRFENSREHCGANSLYLPLFWTFWHLLIVVIGISVVITSTAFLAPLLLREILRAIGGAPAPVWFQHQVSTLFGIALPRAYGIACALALALNSATSILALHHIFFVQPMLGFRMRSLLNHLIFQKALRKERSAATNMSTGFLVNLVGTDTLKISNLVAFLHSVWTHPSMLVGASIMLYWMVGVPALLGSASIMLLLCSSIAISRKQARLRRRLFTLSDSRVSLTRESLLHIKSAKLQGWEDNLAKKIQALRTEESALGRSLARLTAIMSFTSGTAPAVAMAITTSCIALTGGTLDAATLFPMLSLFLMQRFSLNVLPETIYNLMEASLSFQRISTFLRAPEYSPPALDTNLRCAVSLKGVTSVWPDGLVALTVPNVEIAKGALIAVVGSVGAGKTSLLLTLLGELAHKGGECRVGGSLGYVAQNPWVISDSIRNTVLSGKPFDPKRYATAIRASGLISDINSLPHGDSTQIGERGINLSGGQRQRVALARAYYHDAEIYLLDDPLSALDPGVANQVFTQLICKEMAGTTRILVTHRVEFARVADAVIVVENGSVIEYGTPNELQQSDSRFSELLEFHEMVAPEVPTHSEEAIPEADQEDELLETETDASGARIIVKEDRQVGAVARSTISEYIRRLAPGNTLMLLAALFMGRQLAALGTDLWLAWSSSTPNFNAVVFVVGYVACIVVLCVLSYHRSLYVLSRGILASVQSHERLLKGVIHAPLRFFESNPVGRILNRFSRDLETVEINLPRSFLDAGSCLTEISLVCIVIAVFAPITLVVLIPVVMAYYLLFRIYRPISREIQRLCSISLSPIFSVFSESLSGVETLRASGLQGAFGARFRESLDRNIRALYGQTATNRWLGIRLELLGTAVILVVGLATTIGLDIAAGVAFSGLVLCYTSAMTSTMNWAIRSLSMTENNLTSFERMERYASTSPESRGGILPPRGWPESGAVAIRGLEVRYRPDLAPALSGISCTISAGTRVGIVGRTGSGKSTLILSLLRLIEPTAGHIEIDGVDLNSLQLGALRNSIAVVPQEPVLFSGTLRENLDPFSDSSDEAVIAAMKRLQLSTLLSGLPEGLNTTVHEGGFNFSSGQRQLLCLARALLRKSKVIVLDEATAAIDVQTDYAIQRAIREEFRNSTVLVIAHRLGTVIDSDYILALRGGRLAEFGPPLELLSTPGSLLGQFVREVQAMAMSG